MERYLIELIYIRCVDTAKQQVDLCYEEYKRIVDAVPEFDKIGREEYLKTTTLICSRVFNSSEHHEKSLVIPFAGNDINKFSIDMFNFYADQVGQTRWYYDKSEKCFVILACQNIKRGERVIKEFILFRLELITELNQALDICIIMDLFLIITQ